MLLIAGGLSACSKPSPLEPFRGCVLGGIVSLRNGEQQVELECQNPRNLWLVGVPGHEVTAGELADAGLPGDVASLVRALPSSEASRWCGVEEVQLRNGDKSTNEAPAATMVCDSVAGDLDIRRVVQTKSALVRLRLVKDASGRARLDGFEPLASGR